jgi:hypothetical protein
MACQEGLNATKQRIRTRGRNRLFMDETREQLELEVMVRRCVHSGIDDGLRVTMQKTMGAVRARGLYLRELASL